jgi:hypothetical protein
MIQKRNKNKIHFKIVSTMRYLLLSIIFIWMVGYFFCDSLIYYQFDERLMKFIPSPNIVYKHRSEGIAKTYKGSFGINAIYDITKDNREKIVVWGDSYIEAHQVNDENKISQVVTTKLSQIVIGKNLMCFGVGMSGDSVADYYFDIPKYEQLIPDIVSHFIVISDIIDTLPDQSNNKVRAHFRSNPFMLYQDEWRPKYQTVKKRLADFHLYFLWEPIKSILLHTNKLRFMPVIQNHSSQGKYMKNIVYSDKFLFDSWSFLFKKLRKQSELPIALIYCPEIPKVKEGKISFKDNYAREIALLTKIAKHYEIPVLNATEPFISFYKRTGLFPRGFSNSKPSEGHFNEYGHKIVSEIIITQIISEAKR